MIILYLDIDGSIHSALYEDAEYITEEGISAIVTAHIPIEDLAFKYVKLTPIIEVVNKPVNTIAIDKTTIIANSSDTSTITNIASGATVYSVPLTGNIELNALITVTDGVLTVTSNTSGSFKIIINAFPITDYEVTITATEPV